MIQPHLLIDSGSISKYCIIVGKPERVLLFKELLKDFKKVSENRGFLVYNGSYKGKNITICNTGIGGPSAAIAIEELINCGAKVIIRVGSGGVMKKEINTGDVVISTGVCKEERATTLYAPLEFACVPNYDVLKSLIESAESLKIKHYYGITMCTDSFYAKSHRDKMIEWGNLGVVGSDMESSMLFTISQLRGVKAGFIFYAGLNIARKEMHKDIINQDKMRKKGELNAIKIALDALLNV